jgi:SAM-dependent methyltransferase
MTSSPPSPTFRDPAGSLRFEDDKVIRSIHASSRAAVLEFLGSPFCLRAQERGDLIAATIDESASELQLVHPRIPVPSYPWEWTPSQWLAASELTLRLCDEALEDGLILKDATPLNILFVGSQPIFVDILSFERRDPASSIWLAYGQYMRTFLLPLVMHGLMGWPLELSCFKRDGYEPMELYGAMSWRQRLSRRAFWPVTLPTWLERKSGAASASPKPAGNADAEMTKHILKRTLAGLLERTRRAVPKHAPSQWADYSSTLTHYTPEQSAKKREWVRQALEELRPDRVLDIGANTGEFSSLAAAAGAEVVALERDEAAAERLFQMSRSSHSAIQTIHADLARPTPAVGWENAESSALLSRLEGQFEMVMMLAVIHHLILMEQIPLPAILSLCQRLTRRFLILEWVPVADPMYQSLMRGRESLYGSLTETDLLAACEGRFTVLRQLTLGNGRILLLLETAPR